MCHSPDLMSTTLIAPMPQEQNGEMIRRKSKGVHSPPPPPRRPEFAEKREKNMNQ